MRWSGRFAIAFPQIEGYVAIGQPSFSVAPKGTLQQVAWLIAVQEFLNVLD